MTDVGFKRLQISGWRQFQSINIELHPRLTIITGANGAGKSTLLSFFNRHFGYNRSYLAIPEQRGGTTLFKLGLFQVVRRRFGALKTPTPPQGPPIGEIEYLSGVTSAMRVPPNQGLHYSIQIDHEQTVPGLHIDSHRPPNIYRHVTQLPATAPPVAGLGSALNNEYAHYFSSGQVQQGSLHHIKMSLIQMSIFGHGNSTMEPVPALLALFAGFEEKLKVVLPASLGFQKMIIRSPEVLLSTRSGDFLIDAASGGIIKLIEVVWQLYFYSQGLDKFVITFDEPENHLHPSMQKAFLPNIMAAFPNTQIIAVTHSPFIISAMRDSAVYVLRYVDSRVEEREADGDQSIRALKGTRVFAERLDTINKAGSASEILRDVLGITATIPDWAEDRVMEIVGSFQGKKLDASSLQRLYSHLEAEGLASSYPAAVTNLTGAK